MNYIMNKGDHQNSPLPNCFPTLVVMYSYCV